MHSVFVARVTGDMLGFKLQILGEKVSELVYKGSFAPLTAYSNAYAFFLIFLSFKVFSLILLARSETGKRESMPRQYSSRLS